MILSPDNIHRRENGMDMSATIPGLKVSKQRFSRHEKHCGKLIRAKFSIVILGSIAGDVPAPSGDARLRCSIAIHHRVRVFVHHREDLTEIPLVDIHAHARATVGSNRR